MDDKPNMKLEYMLWVVLVEEGTREGGKEATVAGEVWVAEEDKAVSAAKAAHMHRLPPRFIPVLCVAFLYGHMIEAVRVTVIVHPPLGRSHLQRWSPDYLKAYYMSR